MSYLESIPTHVFILLFIAYIIVLIWGYRGPKKYRGDRFFSMVGTEFQQESLEFLHAGQVLTETNGRYS
ncbi:hypothetical protein [Oceanobacillus jeddahense]|uniref:Uncharacterized protein n=1 Tax=Oceanobacillus jeddahense TaxID=1462527 RepID=A0ABY5JL81_9BACI|nr:hypothetical protein [Oceanobacillus jeddahense]UUI01064.1 hypothetical protein NP439_13395 [Oceanobacillus jeddahense]